MSDHRRLPAALSEGSFDKGEFITDDYFRPVKELYPYQTVVQALQIKPFRLISFEERQLRCLYV